MTVSAPAPVSPVLATPVHTNNDVKKSDSPQASSSATATFAASAPRAESVPDTVTISAAAQSASRQGNPPQTQFFAG